MPGVDSSNSQDTSNIAGDGFYIYEGYHTNYLKWRKDIEYQGTISSSQAKTVMSIVADSSYTLDKELGI